MNPGRSLRFRLLYGARIANTAILHQIVSRMSSLTLAKSMELMLRLIGTVLTGRGRKTVTELYVIMADIKGGRENVSRKTT